MIFVILQTPNIPTPLIPVVKQGLNRFLSPQLMWARAAITKIHVHDFFSLYYFAFHARIKETLHASRVDFSVDIYCIYN